MAGQTSYMLSKSFRFQCTARLQSTKAHLMRHICSETHGGAAVPPGDIRNERDMGRLPCACRASSCMRACLFVEKVCRRYQRRRGGFILRAIRKASSASSVASHKRSSRDSPVSELGSREPCRLPNQATARQGTPPLRCYAMRCARLVSSRLHQKCAVSQSISQSVTTLGMPIHAGSFLRVHYRPWLKIMDVHDILLPYLSLAWAYCDSTLHIGGLNLTFVSRQDSVYPSVFTDIFILLRPLKSRRMHRASCSVPSSTPSMQALSGTSRRRKHRSFAAPPRRLHVVV